ncbi:glycogen synthase [Reinekea marinisedimentorum]|uniref:Glycogen synthase n=1 Tax=Reinekea marinisedimentorum TaxID=230495 RepID=A0A4R3I7I9_9GAMM|nr:glycogen/starch synthase [Reinekea marinisedimentorum]TCS41997.1 starch synthase [Reinekea marinisedimentorum]
MKILFITSEVDGLVKTGGLADVAYALPKALIAMGHEVQIVMPAYRKTIESWQDWPAKEFNTPISHFVTETVQAFSGEFKGIPVVAMHHRASFSREGLYDDGNNAYYDNCFRFSVMTKAALEWCKLEDWQPDIVQANDWQSAMASFYLAEHYKADPFFKDTRSAIAIHNGAYQMHADPHWMHQLGIDPRFFNPEDFEDNAHLNVLKGSIGFADAVTTVSPGYAEELTTDLGGHGLDYKFKSLTQPFRGILNGCDYDQWNPETDIWLKSQFKTPDDGGKAICKQDLQQELGLNQGDQIPFLGVICRLVDQKGIHLLIPVFWNLMAHHDCQVVVLGSGDAKMAAELDEIQNRYPDRFRFINGYNIGLSHRIEASIDAFLMPSIFEPCGLNQIYSLRYGTVPLVREVGGLRDTVCKLEYSRANADEATGFMFQHLDEETLLQETLRLLDVYKHDKELWMKLQNNGMAKRFTWEKSAKEYEKLYKEILALPKMKHPLV